MIMRAEEENYKYLMPKYMYIVGLSAPSPCNNDRLGTDGDNEIESAEEHYKLTHYLF